MLKSMMRLTLVYEQQPTEKMLVEPSQSVTCCNLNTVINTQLQLW